MAVCALFSLSLWLRTYALDRDALNLDEATSVLFASKPLAELVRSLSRDSSPPLYFVLLRAWMSVFGDTEYSVRFLSAVLGALLPPTLYVATSRLFGRPAGIFAAVFALLNPLHVFYSQQTRMYSLLPLLSLSFSMALIDASRAQLATRWALVGVLGAAMLWTHNYGLFVICAAPGFCLALTPPPRLRTLSGLGFALLLTLALYAPWLPVLLQQRGSGVASVGRQPSRDNQSRFLRDTFRSVHAA